MISIKRRFTIVLSLKTIINSKKSKLSEVIMLCWSGLSTSLLFKKPKMQILLSGGKMLQLDLIYINHKIYMYWLGGVSFPVPWWIFTGALRLTESHVPPEANIIHSGLKMQSVGYTHSDPVLRQALCQTIPGSRNETVKWNGGIRGQGQIIEYQQDGNPEFQGERPEDFKPM